MADYSTLVGQSYDAARATLEAAGYTDSLNTGCVAAGDYTPATGLQVLINADQTSVVVVWYTAAMVARVDVLQR